jgi:hypothetical protein
MTPTYAPGPGFKTYGPALSRSRLRAAALFFGMLALAVMAILLPAIVHGQTPDPGADPSSFLLSIVTAIQGGDWRGLAVLVAIGVTWAAKKYGAKLWPFLGTARGGAALALFLGFAGTLVPALAGGASITPKLAIDALLFGLTSIGGWVGVRRLIWGDVSAQVNAEAAKVATPLPADATLEQLRDRADRPVG